MASRGSLMVKRKIERIKTLYSKSLARRTRRAIVNNFWGHYYYKDDDIREDDALQIQDKTFLRAELCDNGVAYFIVSK